MTDPLKPDDVAEIARTVLALEREALSRWGRGDPSGFLEISDPSITYFDPFQPRRVEGIESLAAIYEALRGKIRIDADEILDPRVQVVGDVAVLTYNYVSQTAGRVNRWNCTEVFRRSPQGFRILQTHWSFIQPLSA